MRTTITLSEDIIHELLHYTHCRTRTEGVNTALKEWLRWRKLQELKQLRGKLMIEDNVKTLRKMELSEYDKDHKK